MCFGMKNSIQQFKSMANLNLSNPERGIMRIVDCGRKSAGNFVKVNATVVCGGLQPECESFRVGHIGPLENHNPWRHDIRRCATSQSGVWKSHNANGVICAAAHYRHAQQTFTSPSMPPPTPQYGPYSLPPPSNGVVFC